MNTYIKSEIFQTNISLTSHVQAEKFRRYQSQTIKAKQVYLNTLAVFAANSYLNMIGWSSNLSGGDSWNPICQTMMNTADLYIPDYGKLECRPMLAGEDTVIVPPEVWSARIGYLIVRLEPDLKSAEIIGFARQIGQTKLPICELESLSEFPNYLSQQKRSEPSNVTKISSWIDGALNYGWQKLEELFSDSVILNFRSKQKLTQLPIFPAANRVKLIKLGKDSKHTIALILNIQPSGDREFDVSISVSNYLQDLYLPEGLELIIVDRYSHPVMIAQANQTETIEFRFSAELQEHFTVEISLDEQLIVENFIV